MVHSFECGHAGKSHAVGNDVMQLSIAQALCGGRSQIGHTRVQMSANARAASAVGPVAPGALRQKDDVTLLQRLSIAAQWILGSPFTPGNREVPNPAAHRRFRRGWGLYGAEASPDHEQGNSGAGYGCPEHDANGSFPHGAVPASSPEYSHTIRHLGRRRTGLYFF